VKKNASEVFTEEVRNYLVTAIEANDFQEASFVGNVDKNGIVYEIESLAYGNEDSTPVVLMEALRWDVLIHNHPGDGENNLRASEQDIALATELANKKIGFYIIDNQCRFVNVLYKPEGRVYLNPAEIRAIYEKGGILSRNIAYFESRAEQIEMVEKIVDAINDSKLLISEAGTGTGKSLSYLIPSAIWAVENKKRVIVSTQTINLQQQIAGKDMLIVEKVISEYLKKDVHYSVLIGKGNYLCRKKLAELIRDRERQETLFTDEKSSDLLFEIEEWSRRCNEGTVGEYGKFVSEEIWEELACDSLSCTYRKCPFYGDCFYYKAKLEAEKSNVIIVNHSLVFSTIDEQSHRSMLPFFSGIVFDEAHHIEDVALKTLSREISIQSLLYQIHKIYSRRGEKEYGFLVLLERRGNVDAYPELKLLVDELKKKHQFLISSLADFIIEMGSILKSRLKETNAIGLDDDFVNTEDYKTVFSALSHIFKEIMQFSTLVEDLISRLKNISFDKDVVDIVQIVQQRLQRLSEAKGTFELIFNTENEINYVKWIEVTKKNIRLYYSPLEVGDFLANSLFSRKDFTIFTSATLLINGKFDYFKNSIGLLFAGNKEKEEVHLPSPFNYEKQAEIYILEENIDHSRVSEEKIAFVRELSFISEGGVLILFTSYLRLNEMYKRLKEDMTAEGLLPLKQGEASRDELLRKMSVNPNVVLFATSSFWEGIDIQGDNLRCVIIEKLPFDSPADPVYKAKVNLLKFKGLNPFVHYSIPRAVLRLKQGMGRLIRSKTDKGVIAIMDNRIKTKTYGSIFLNSLPPAKIISGRVGMLIREAERFFANRF